MVPMRVNPRTLNLSMKPAKNPRAAFSLIEMVAVLSVLAILAAAMLPVLLRGYDRVARDRESRCLEGIGNSLRRHVLRNCNIPGPAEFAQAIAIELGCHISQVLTNERGLRRVYLIDPGITATVAMPFTQGDFGVTNQVGPGVRVALLSSIGEALPANITNGMAASAAIFSNVWNVGEGQVPAGWSWGGRGQDLRIQRIDLDGLFVPVILNYEALTVFSSNRGRFSINNGGTNILPTTPTYVASVLKGSVLGLHHHAGTTNTLQVREVIQHPVSYIYDRDAWRGRLFLGRGLRVTTGIDLQAAHDLAVASPLNPNAQGTPQATPVGVILATSNYLRSFLVWKTNGYPSSGASYNAVNSAQKALDTISMDLLHKP
jgi:prepilin-type N-terminal cleavage/methylation domain-containing protein